LGVISEHLLSGIFVEIGQETSAKELVRIRDIKMIIILSMTIH
jgi:hypothetical protein